MKDINKLATLANLKLTTDEAKKLQAQLTQILDYMKILEKVDTSKVEETSQVTGLENVFRNDEVKPQPLNPKHGQYFKVASISKK